MTRMACPDMQYEDAFVKMLDEVDRFEIKGAELTATSGRVMPPPVLSTVCMIRGTLWPPKC